MQTAAPAYNVFRRKHQPALRCAVPLDLPVPSFVSGETWDFGGTVTGEQPPPGFKPEAADQAVRHTGYYLFHAVQA